MSIIEDTSFNLKDPIVCVIIYPMNEGMPLPTSETTRFNDRTVVAVDFVAKSLFPEPKQRDKARKELVRFGNDSQKGRVLFDVVTELSDDAAARGTEERRDQYKELKDHLGRNLIFVFPDDNLSDDDPRKKLQLAMGRRMVGYEVASRNPLIDASVDVVNQMASAALPEEFGFLIPELKKEHVHAATESSFRNMQKIPEMDEAGIAEIYEIYRNHGYGDSVDENPISHINLSTFNFANGAPFIYHNGLLKIMDQNRKYSSREVASLANARTFSHENIHRGHKVKINEINIDDAFSLAVSQRISAEENVRITGNRELGEALKAQSDKLLEVAREKQAFSVVTGAIVRIAYIDEKDGMFKILAQGGYDMNEAMVEHFMKPILSKMSEHFGRHYSHLDTPRGDFRRMFSTEKSDSSHMLIDYSSQVDSYLRSLGLTTYHEQLAAFQNGEIPLLHLQKFGASKRYFA